GFVCDLRCCLGVPPAGIAIAPAPAATLSLPQKAEEIFVRFLTPTENKRLNELVGFLCISLAVLIALALISYSPKDPSWNVSTPEGAPTQNWIGPAGAYAADSMFQGRGCAAFLLPMFIAGV